MSSKLPLSKQLELLDRNKLKALIKLEGLSFKVSKDTTDEEIRSAILEELNSTSTYTSKFPEIYLGPCKFSKHKFTTSDLKEMEEIEKSGKFGVIITKDVYIVPRSILELSSKD